MDNVSVNKASSLYWLGRYAERAYTLSHLVTEFYDRMVDFEEHAYEEFSCRLGIESTFNDKNEFLKRIITNSGCESSIAHDLQLAYDNSIILREQIDTETVAYIQLALNNVNRMKEQCRIYDLQRVIDNLMSFWGAVDDLIVDDSVRDAIKSGKYVERIDLFTRFGKDENTVNGCKRRLLRHISHLDTEGECFELNYCLAENSPTDIGAIEASVAKLF